MEQPPHQGGDLQDTQASYVLSHSPEDEPHNTPASSVPPHEGRPPQNQQPHESLESHDERVIREGIEQAHQAGTDIDNRTARYIAAQLHEGQSSALYSLASTGAITESVQDELTRNLNQQTTQVQTWITWLGAYCLNREHKGPIPDWAASTAATDQTEEEERTRVELMARLSAAAMTTLGEIAVVVTDEQAADAEETDSFPWTDAASWSPSAIATNDIDTQSYPPDELAALFTEPPDEEIGDVSELGWYGRIKHEDKPGGLILIQDEHGFRHVREAQTDEALEVHWTAIQQRYETYHHQRDAYELATSETTTAPSGSNPRIWVGSLADYTNGRLYGAWMDATLQPDELHAAISFLLRNGYTPGAEEWAIMDYEDFCGLNLGEYEPLEAISRIANGIAEHGEAFAKWVEYTGERSEELLTNERFQDHYLGHFDSAEAYAEYFLEETGAYSYLDEIPESLRVYAKFDTELMGRDMESELYVVEADSGGVYVFDPRG